MTSSASFGPQGAPLLTPPTSPVSGHVGKPFVGDTVDRVALKEMIDRPKNGFHYQRVVEGSKPILSSPTTKSNGIPATTQLAMPDAIVKNNGPEGLALIHRTSYGPGADTPVTVPERFGQVARENPDAVAYYTKQGPEVWQSTTYAEYYQLTRTVAKAFLSLGLQRFHSVAIIGFNSAEWFVTNFAAIFAGGLSTGVYTTNSPEACLHILNDCRANICVVEGQGQMKKILKIKDELPYLKAVIQYRGQLDLPIGLATSKIKFLMWDDLLALAINTSEAILDEVIGGLSPGNCCTLIYTSGTTGNPKGVMISHDNLTWTARQTGRTLNFRKCMETIVSYLPLSHVAAQITDMYLIMDSACTIWFANPDALKGSLVPTLKDAKPTIFIGVPRVWEKMAEKMQAVSKSVGGLKRFIATWAKNVGTRGSEAMMLGSPLPWGWWLADTLVFRKVKRSLGLDQCRYLVSTGAPTSRQTIDYFASLNIRIMEVYGMSECSGPASINYCSLGQHWIGSSGLPLCGSSIKINYDIDVECNGNGPGAFGEATGVGEVCLKGRHVFMGYLNMKDQTEQTLESDGWLHTGDIGKMEKTKSGGPFLFITGRLKEMIITAGGENIAPIPIENAIKEELKEIVSNAMVVGDYKKFLAVLLTLKTEIDESTGLPTDLLIPSARDFFTKKVGYNDSPITSVQHVMSLKSPSIFNAIQMGIDKANERSISRAANVRKWTILPKDFSVAGGEYGPTLKLRRSIVLRKFAQTIESLYSESEEGDATMVTTKLPHRDSSVAIDVSLQKTTCNGNAAFSPDG